MKDFFNVLLKQVRVNHLVASIAICIIVANYLEIELDIYINLIGGVCTIYLVLIIIAFITNKAKQYYKKRLDEKEYNKKIAKENKKKNILIERFYDGLSDEKKKILKYVSHVGVQDKFNNNIRVISKDTNNNDIDICHKASYFSCMKTESYGDYNLITINRNGNDCVYIKINDYLLQIINKDYDNNKYEGTGI